MNGKTARKLKELRPDTIFQPCGVGYVTYAGELSDDELFYCPALDHEKGCILGEDKPFDCRIWPFRVMKLDELLAITVSPVCDSVSSLPLKKLCEFLSGGMGDTIFKAAEEYPDMIKDYIDGYPILAVKRA